MSEAETATVPPSSPFGMPKWDIPNFDISKMEVPAAFREIAEKSLTQAKEQYEKIKATAEQATDVLEETYTAASNGCAGYGLKLIEAARANSNATFDLMSGLMTAKSCSEAVELSSSYWRKQFDALTTQAKDLADHAQKVATEAAEPVKASFSSAVKKVA
ncbi:MAG TPA: phasin [Pseudolabrys sp.]|jgi:phasin|nr:phasin [Pseudolabrys sp.]